MKRTRVVVTGFSAITPLATSAMESWNALLAGKSGIGPISLFDATGYDATIAGEVKNFDPASFGISPKQTRHMDRFVQFGASAALELMRHSRYKVDESNAERIGVMVGVGLGGLHTIEQFHTKLIFGDDTVAYKIGVKPLRKKDLQDFKPEDKIVNRFEEILRHNNVSDKENAFNRLVALFICKL